MPAFPNPNITATDVLDALHTSGKPINEWGRAVDDTPILSASTGAGKQPAILVTAGVHAGETAGVQAALKLLKQLETRHEVVIVPLRDPFGFAGVNHCLSFAAHQPIHLSNHSEILEYLKQAAKLLWNLDDIWVFRLNEIGFIWRPLHKGDFYRMIDQIGELSRSNPHVFKSLWGKRVMLLNPDIGCEGNGEMQRCWHGVFSEQGEWLHLNRFFGRSDHPSEVAAIKLLIQTIRPGLICDLQEDRVSGFWLGIPRPRQGSEKMFQMAEAFISALRMHNSPIFTLEDMLASKHTDTAIPGLLEPEERLPGMIWMNILPLGEGHNLLTYAATFASAFGVEAPMHCPLAMRVEGTTQGIQAALRVWETLDEKST